MNDLIDAEVVDVLYTINNHTLTNLATEGGLAAPLNTGYKTVGKLGKEPVLKTGMCPILLKPHYLKNQSLPMDGIGLTGF